MLFLVLAAALWGFGPSQEVPDPAKAPAPAGSADAYRFERVRYVDRLEKDGTLLRTIETRVKLNTPQGVAQFGQIALPYLVDYGDVQFEEVTVEKSDGRRIPIANGIVEDVNPYGMTASSLSADLHYKRMTLPGLEAGDRLFYRISNRQKPLAPGRIFGNMAFWPVASYLLQTYDLDVPRDLSLTVRLRKDIGTDWEAVPSSPDRLVRRISLKVETPALTAKTKKSGAQAAVEPDVTFTNFSSWNEVAGWWWNLSKDRFAPDGAMAKEAARLVAGATTPREKLAALWRFSSSIRYLNVNFGLGRMQPRKATDVFTNRYGDCKDKHALLAALASSLKIDVRPVLLNSEREIRDDAPSPAEFDHVVSVARLGAAPDEWLWLDGTNAFGGPGYLLSSLRDKRAVLVEPDGSASIVQTPKDPPFVPTQEATFKATLSDEGVLKGHLTWGIQSDLAVMMRAGFASLSHEQATGLFKTAFGETVRGSSKAENLSFSDPLDLSVPFRIEVDIEGSLDAKNGERRLRAVAPPIGLPEPNDDASPPEAAVTFSYREFHDKTDVEIPEGESARAPLSITIERPFGTYRSSYTVEGRSVRIERTLRLSVTTLPVAEVASYNAFRSAVSKDREQTFTITGLKTVTPTVTAAGLHADGLAAYNKREYAAAAELFKKATDADSKVADGFVDLGRSLHELGKHAEAVEAFSRQIEITPFHENAYAWRAYCYEPLGKWKEAEQDLQKQIETAPFQVWSYEKLGKWRISQRRYADAVDLLSRAATIEPKAAFRWVDLADAQVKAQQQESARKSLDQAIQLQPPDWLKLKAALLYHSIGDFEPAGRLGAEAAPALAQRLTRLAADKFGTGDLGSVTQLAQAWFLMGDAALRAGDLAKAEKYLQAAWQLEFLPEAAWALGDLREKQGRLADGVELWMMASDVPSAPASLPTGWLERIRAAVLKLPEAQPGYRIPASMMGTNPTERAQRAREDLANESLQKLRTVRAAGPAVGDFAEEVVLLVRADGTVERINDLSRNAPDSFDKQIAQLAPLHLDLPRPDEAPYKAVRKGLLVCSRTSNCALMLDLPGLGDLTGSLPSITGSQAIVAMQDFGTISITKLDPVENSILKRGERVNLTATVRYSFEGEEAYVVLLVLDEVRRGAPLQSAKPLAIKGPSGEVTLTTTFVVPDDAKRIHVLLPMSKAGTPAKSSAASATFDVR